MRLCRLASDGSEDALWDACVEANPASGFMQSSRWAAFKRAEGFLVHRLGLWEGERLFGGGTLYGYPGAAGTPGIFSCPEGPVLPWSDVPRARRGIRLLLQAAREAGGLGLRIEPHLPPPTSSLLRNWQRAPVDLTTVHTLLLDLTLSEEALLAQMKPKGRYNIKVAARHGVTVRESRDPADLPHFYRLFQETTLRNKLFAEPYSFFLNLAASWFADDDGSLFLAEWQGEPLAALLILRQGHRGTYLYGGSTVRHREVMPCYALHWEVAKTLRARGCTEYDFFGYDPYEHPVHLYAGISRFKRQFGGFRRTGIGAQDLLFYDQLAEQLLTRFE